MLKLDWKISASSVSVSTHFAIHWSFRTTAIRCRQLWTVCLFRQLMRIHSISVCNFGSILLKQYNIQALDVWFCRYGRFIDRFLSHVNGPGQHALSSVSRRVVCPPRRSLCTTDVIRNVKELYFPTSDDFAPVGFANAAKICTPFGTTRGRLLLLSIIAAIGTDRKRVNNDC